jgi:hypothetical protein
MHQANEANRKLFDAWASGMEASLRAAFEVQNAALSTGRALMDASTESSRTVVQQWTEATREAQQATLDVWQAGFRAAMHYSGFADAAGQQ